MPKRFPLFVLFDPDEERYVKLTGEGDVGWTRNLVNAAYFRNPGVALAALTVLSDDPTLDRIRVLNIPSTPISLN
jgi:hypothetical protein